MTEENNTTMQEADADEYEARPYFQVYIGLFVLTIFEFLTSRLDDWNIITVTAVLTVALVIFASAKVILIGAFFMHAKYEYDTKYIVIGTVLIPLIGITLLSLMMTLDFRGKARPF